MKATGNQLNVTSAQVLRGPDPHIPGIRVLDDVVQRLLDDPISQPPVRNGADNLEFLIQSTL